MPFLVVPPYLYLVPLYFLAFFIIASVSLLVSLSTGARFVIGVFVLVFFVTTVLVLVDLQAERAMVKIKSKNTFRISLQRLMS